MPTRSSKRRPTDPNELAAFIVRQATSDDKPDDAEPEEAPPEREKNPAAVALGRLGGQKGGKARAASLTPEKRAEIARKAAKARWKKADGDGR